MIACWGRAVLVSRLSKQSRAELAQGSQNRECQNWWIHKQKYLRISFPLVMEVSLLSQTIVFFFFFPRAIVAEVHCSDRLGLVYNWFCTYLLLQLKNNQLFSSMVRIFFFNIFNVLKCMKKLQRTKQIFHLAISRLRKSLNINVVYVF